MRSIFQLKLNITKKTLERKEMNIDLQTHSLYRETLRHLKMSINWRKQFLTNCVSIILGDIAKTFWWLVMIGRMLFRRSSWKQFRKFRTEWISLSLSRSLSDRRWWTIRSNSRLITFVSTRGDQQTAADWLSCLAEMRDGNSWTYSSEKSATWSWCCVWSGDVGG